MAKAPRTSKPYSALSPAQRGWITRRARAAGKDPTRVHAGLRAAETRARKAEQAAREHGRKARERTERQLAAKQKAARTRDAARIKREAAKPKRERIPTTTTRGKRVIRSIDDFDDYPDYDDGEIYDAEGHQETTGKKGK